MAIAYAKYRTTFASYAQMDIGNYNLVYDSIYGDNSTFQIIGDCDIDEGDFFIWDDYIGKIQTITPGEDNTTDIVCSNILEFFNRYSVYPGVSTHIEEFINDEMTSEYKSIADTVYDMPYLSITATEATTFIQPDITTVTGMYNLKSYITRARRVSDVFTDFTYSRTALNVNIIKRTPDSHNIILDKSDGLHELISRSISSSSIAKITTYQGSTEKDWYLSSTGAITNAAPASRATGEWIGIALETDDTDTDAVADEFAKNSKSHKIEFRSTEDYTFYDTVSLRIGNSVYSSYISYKGKDSGDSRYLYKSGELQTTLSDKLREMI